MTTASPQPSDRNTDTSSPSPALRPALFVTTYVDYQTTFYCDRGTDPNATPIVLSIHVDGDDPPIVFEGEALPIAAIPGRFFGLVLDRDRRAASYASDLLAPYASDLIDTTPDPSAS